MIESKPKFKVKLDKYSTQLNFGFNLCYDDFGPDANGKHWTEYYAILHLGKYYLVIGRMD